MVKDPRLAEAQEQVRDNLSRLKMALEESVKEGLVDLESDHYNELLDLLTETSLSKSFEELLEVVAKAKALETEIAAWSVQHGRTSFSLSWPG